MNRLERFNVIFQHFLLDVEKALKNQHRNFDVNSTLNRHRKIDCAHCVKNLAKYQENNKKKVLL